MPRPKGSKNKPKLKPQIAHIDIHEELRLACLTSFQTFVETVQPKRLLGFIHTDIMSWCTRQDALSHQLILLPRDHQKSAVLGGLRAAWEVVKNPAIRILYISATAPLAVKQLKFIKDILTSDNVRLLWPDLINKDEGRRELWTQREISVDHPKRREEYIRDPTIFTAGLTTNIVGLHCDIAIMDDIVTDDNAYTEEGREKVKDQYSLLSSIEGTGAKEWVVGTRYHPKDLYSELMNMEVEEFDEYGNKTNSRPLFETREHAVESIGDGTGEFLWPRQQRSDGRWFGFDTQVLAIKRSQYLNKVHFRAQYYNDPHDATSAPIQRDCFQYYDPVFLSSRNGNWEFKGNRLNVFAAVDFAFSLSKKADYTAIAVVGCDTYGNYYILDLDRFRTDKISDYFKHILDLHTKWGFRKIRAEVTAGQQPIVKDLKDSYIRPLGLSLSIDEFRPSRFTGSKEERILAVLEPKYNNRQIWHYPGGNCQILEEELIFMNPSHDDCKDALASAIDLSVPPLNVYGMGRETRLAEFNFHTRFGGVL
jgi:phage terminase large subunit-like protein